MLLIILLGYQNCNSSLFVGHQKERKKTILLEFLLNCNLYCRDKWPDRKKDKLNLLKFNLLVFVKGQVASLQMDLVELDVRRAREAEKVISNIDNSMLTPN